MSTPPSSSPPGWWRSSPSPSSSSPPSPSGWCGCTGSCWCPWVPALPPTTCSILRIVHWPMNKIERCHLWPIILSYKTCYLYYICISFSFCNTEYMGKFKVRYFMKCWRIWLTLQNEFLSVHLENEISVNIKIWQLLLSQWAIHQKPKQRSIFSRSYGWTKKNLAWTKNKRKLSVFDI